MGQYLAMGLTHKISASLNEMKKEKISKEELLQQIEREMLFDMTRYDETSTDRSLVFTLKHQLLESDLIPFLEAFYPIAYAKNEAEHYHGVLECLKSTPATQWLELAEKKRFEAFQFDRYGESRYIEFSKPFRPCLRLSFDFIILQLGYGKISTEGIENMMDLFKYCMTETFKEYPIV
jgi:hypothetical protein